MTKKNIEKLLSSKITDSKFAKLVVESAGKVKFFSSVAELENFCHGRKDVKVVVRENGPCTYITLFEKRGEVWVGWDFWENENRLEIYSPSADYVFSNPVAPVCTNGAMLMMNEEFFLGLCSSFFFAGHTQEESQELCAQIKSLEQLWQTMEERPYQSWAGGAQMAKVISSNGDSGWQYTTIRGRSFTLIDGVVYLDGFEESESLRSSLLKSTDLLETPEWTVTKRTNRPIE